MPEFFLELFSEEIPARMQREAGIQLEKICASALAPLKINIVEVFTGPRRIALKAILNAQTEAKQIEERGPRDTAPEAALAGFLGKHKASREDVVAEGGYFLLRRTESAVTATDLITTALPAALAKFSWPKSMRWGQSGPFTWVRPLRHIVCLLDGATIPFTLGPITAGNTTEGHRFLSSGAFSVSSASDWQTKLRERHVIADQSERRALIVAGLTEKAAALNLTLADDPGLIDEVTGLVEWPVPLIGKIDANFMDLPPEVRELSMKVNQRYFALRDSAGKPAPYFAFISNIEAKDFGNAIIAGNERVLRARLSDARHFWDLDIKTPLINLLPKLDNVTFHAKLGSQGDRVKRISDGVYRIGSQFSQTYQDNYQSSQRAALLSKCDLITGMVGEFPELQGVMGSYYARHDGEKEEVADAIRMQYFPRGPKDTVPSGPVAINLSLADKFDQIVAFFAIGERPTGAGDPYALRRAGLGIIRIILENELDFNVKQPIHDALEKVRQAPATNLADIALEKDIFEFLIERLRVKLRSEGQRYDILNAVLSSEKHDNLLEIMFRVTAVTNFLSGPEGKELLFGYRRGINILKAEEAKDNCVYSAQIEGSLVHDSEKELEKAIKAQIANALTDPTGRSLSEFTQILQGLAQLNRPVNTFLELRVNDQDPKIRRNRLALLALLRDTMHQIADFSKIEG